MSTEAQTQRPNIAFLGATGGCVGQCLALALNSNEYNCYALARTPSKLSDSLAEKGVSKAALARLTIIQGDAKDPSSVKRLLTAPASSSSATSGSSPSMSRIVFGIGAYPKLQFSFNFITMDDPQVCESAMAALMSAISELRLPVERRPDVVALSTTGLTSVARDVPFLLMPLYHVFLALPHRDKKAMEKLLWDQTKMDKEQRPTRSFVIVRPTLLTAAKVGLERIRWGSEKEPAIGYSIGRPDVGEFIFEKVIRGQDQGREVVERDAAVTLTS